MLAYSTYFYLVHAGQGRWMIRHRITDESAGVVARGGDGFDIFDDTGRLLGHADSIEHALGELYESA